MAILLALAAPSFTPIIERWRVRSAAESLTSTLYYARSEAIKRGGGITIDAGSDWNAGWGVYQNGTPDALQVNPAPNKVSIAQSNSNKTILYIDRWGMVSDDNKGIPAAMNMAIYPKDKTDTDISAIRLCIGLGGRIVQMKQGAACPT